MAVEKITQPITQVGLINKVNELIDQSITVDSTISSTSENPVQNKVIYQALTAKADATAIPTKTSDLTNDSNFLQTITVNGTAQAATGTTVDISIPAAQTIGDAYLTIKRNGTAIGSFSANSTVPVSIDMTVPTQASDIGALPDSTVIGAGNVTIKRNGTAIGTINVNQTVSAAIDITVPAAVTVDTVISSTSTNPVQNKVIYTALTAKADKTEIPTVGDSNLVVQQNGTAVGTFGANATSPVTIDVTDTTYSAGSGLSLSGTTINHSNTITPMTVWPSITTLGGAVLVELAAFKFDGQGHSTGGMGYTRKIHLGGTTYDSVTETLTIALDVTV